MNEFNVSVGKRIRKLRESYGYTREKLAERAEMNDKFLYEVEVGRKGLSAQKMSKVAVALGVSMDYLATGIQDHKRYGEIIPLLGSFSGLELKNIQNILRNVIEIINSHSAE